MFLVLANMYYYITLAHTTAAEVFLMFVAFSFC